MVESVLYFLLGFLCAGLIVGLIAPAIWRRAVLLTHRRIAASTPLSMAEIQANKDRLRAEFAMTTRRLEITAKTLRDKASAQIIDIGQMREEIKRLHADLEAQRQMTTTSQATAQSLQQEIAEKEEQLKGVSAKLAEAEKARKENRAEIQNLSRLHEEASFAASSRQIDLAAKDAEIDKLSAGIAKLRAERKEFDRELRETGIESRLARDAVKTEKKKLSDLEKKFERTLTVLSDREEKLERREKEMARLRERLKGSTRHKDDLDAKLVDTQSERVKLESEHADLTMQMSALRSEGGTEETAPAVSQLAKDRQKLEKRLVELTRENRRLSEEAASADRTPIPSDGLDAGDSFLLREEMHNLAAEVVRLTAMIEGPDSPIEKALSAANGSAGSANRSPMAPANLADRVRALQRAAAVG